VIASFQPFYARLTTNKLVKFTYAMANFKGHNSELANQVIDECLQLQEGYFSIPYLNYFKGKILLQKQMYPQARYYFELFLKEHEGQNNVKDAYFQIFISYWLNNNESQAQKYFEIAKTKGKSISPADSYADNLLTQNEFPNQAIMQIRLATDGGYFELAQLLLAEIKTDEIKSEKEEIEVIYRRARLLHLQGNLNGAITYYQQTIQLSGENPWYFAPNSALQLGHIYLSQHKTAIAKDYYEMVFKYKHHPYKNSLNQEAKSALSRINN
jgi:tetratricopeptide (TPR) repeat protein